MTTFRRRSILCCAAASLLAASCGSSSGSESAASTTTGTVPVETTPETTAPVTTPDTTEGAPEAMPSTSTPTSSSSTTAAPRDPALLYLPVMPVLGETAHQVATTTSSSKLDAPGETDDASSTTKTVLSIDREVTDVGDEVYTVTESIVDAIFESDGAAADPETTDLIVAAFDELRGIEVDGVYGFDGVQLERSVVGEQDLSDVASNIITTPTPTVDYQFSPDGIAVGDIWTVDLSSAELGVPLPITYTLELVAFDGEAYEISISVDQDVSELFGDPQSTDVRLTGTGSISGVTSNSLLVSSSIKIEISGTLTDPDGSTGTIEFINESSMVSTPI